MSLGVFRRLRPPRFLRLKPEYQGSAAFRVRFLFENDENSRRMFHGPAKTKPHLERNVADHVRRSVAQIEGDQTEASALDEQIGGAEGLVDIPAADPEDLLEGDARSFGGMRVEGVSPIDEGAHFILRRSFG